MGFAIELSVDTIRKLFGFIPGFEPIHSGVEGSQRTFISWNPLIIIVASPSQGCFMFVFFAHLVAPFLSAFCFADGLYPSSYSFTGDVPGVLFYCPYPLPQQGFLISPEKIGARVRSVHYLVFFAHILPSKIPPPYFLARMAMNTPYASSIPGRSLVHGKTFLSSSYP